jgi:hypothetical protein
VQTREIKGLGKVVRSVKTLKRRACFIFGRVEGNHEWTRINTNGLYEPQRHRGSEKMFESWRVAFIMFSRLKKAGCRPAHEAAEDRHTTSVAVFGGEGKIARTTFLKNRLAVRRLSIHTRAFSGWGILAGRAELGNLILSL